MNLQLQLTSLLVVVVALATPTTSILVQLTNRNPRILESSSAKAATNLLEAFTSKNYTKLLHPNFGTGERTQVNVTMYIISLSDISEKSMDFRSQFYFRQTWIDPRLVFTPEAGVDTLYMRGEACRKFWTPDTFFSNAKSSRNHKLLISGEDAEFCRVKSNGEVFLSKMFDLTAGCSMDLAHYPFDQQLCSIEVESYGFSMKDINFHWAKGKESVGFNKQNPMADFKVVCVSNEETVETLSSGQYKRLAVKIHLARNSSPYVKQIYLPAFLLSVLSWYPLWLHQSKNRIALALLITLTATLFNTMATAHLPAQSFSKTLDCYLLINWFLIFATVVESAVSAFFGGSSGYYKKFAKGSEEKLTGSEKINLMDKWARWIIPAVGMIFNLVYLMDVLTKSSAAYSKLQQVSV